MSRDGIFPEPNWLAEFRKRWDAASPSERASIRRDYSLAEDPSDDEVVEKVGPQLATLSESLADFHASGSTPPIEGVVLVLPTRHADTLAWLERYYISDGDFNEDVVAQIQAWNAGKVTTAPGLTAMPRALEEELALAEAYGVPGGNYDDDIAETIRLCAKWAN